ncbi:MAG: alpha-ketoglutarate-dependent dioxygenase AlkB, partial [Pseudomonadota bacterium]|nr:alpha-ketoglutarate-dependent dioxygenase AlkB [Pseudomonadota bacterium]
MTAHLQMDFLKEKESPPAMSGIVGITYVPEYIDRQQEADLIRTIDAQPWITELKRRVQHYGYRYDYKARSIAPESRLGPLPEWLSSYCHRLHADGLFS